MNEESVLSHSYCMVQCDSAQQ